MKKIITLLTVVILLIANASFAQIDIRTVRTRDIDQMKADGKLTGKEQYVNYQADPNPARIAPNNNSTTSSAAGCNCWIPRDGTWQVAAMNGSGGSGGPGVAPDYRNDDWSTVALTLPFNFCFYGANITNGVYINNNGSVSIGAAYSIFTADSFPSPNYVMIAPFWGDVDTRGAASGLVYYQLTPTHLIVQWESVGYYGTHDDKLSTFQLIMTDGADQLLPPNSNVSFCYKDMAWTTGDASGGVGGFGGTAATVGINQGNGTDYIQIGRYDQPGTSYDGPFGSADGVDMLDNQSFILNACQSGSNVPPILNSVQVCDTLTVCQGDTLLIAGTFLSPEANQITTCSVASLMTGLSVVSNIPGNTADFVVQVIGLASNLGMNRFDLVGTDNGAPARSIRVPVVINVIPTPVPSYTQSPSGIVNVGDPITFTNTSTGVVPGVLYHWDFGDGDTSNVFSPVHSYSTGGNYTVTLTITNPGGCITTITQQVSVFTCAVAALTVTDECLGTPSTVTFTGVTIPAASYTWNFNGGTVVSGSGVGPYEITWGSDGTYAVSVAVDVTGCPTASASQNTTIYAVPVASFLSTPSVCAGAIDNINFNGFSPAGTNITWDFDGGTGGGAGPGPFNITWANAGTYTVEAIANNSGCADTVSTTITVNPIPTSTFAATPSVCAGSAVTATYGGTATAGATYTWDLAGATVASGSGQGPYSLSWNTAGTYNLTLSVVENGCTSPVTSQQVVVNAIPTAAINATPALCVGAANNVTFTGVAGAGANYAWNFGTAQVNSGSGAGPYSLQWNAATNEQITLTVTENGCSNNTTFNVSVTPIPNSPFTATTSVCSGDNVSVAYSGTASAGATYTWDYAGGTSSGSGQGPFNVVWNTPGTYNMGLTVSENGCTSPLTNVSVVVNPIPVASMSATPAVCIGQQNVITFTGNALPNANYAWNFGTATVNSGSGAGPYNVQWNSSGPQSIQLTVTQNTCANQATINVNVNAIPTSVFTLPNAVCEGVPFAVTYTGTAQASATFNWNFGTATVNSGSGIGPYSLVASAGSPNVSLTVTENGCTSPPTNLNITIAPTPIVTAGVDAAVCSGIVVQAGGAPQANTTYSWTPTSGIDNPAASQINVTLTNNGTGTVQTPYYVTATNSFGCVNKDTVLLSAHAIPSAQFPNQAAQCLDGNSFNFVPVGNLFAGVDYAWNFSAASDQDTSSLQNPPAVSFNSVGVFPVTLAVSYRGCPGTPYASTVEILEMPRAEFMPTVFHGCAPLEVPFDNTSSPNSNTFSWSFSDGQTDSHPFPIHHFTQAGIYDATLTVTTADGCSMDTTLLKIIEVYPVPVAAFVADPDIATIYEPIIHFDNHTVYGAYYSWDFGDSSAWSSQTSPYHTFDAVGNYEITLMVESDHQCRDTIRGLIRIEYGFSFFVPSAFTPNGDGVNDYFQGYGTFIKDYEMSIFDRWGLEVFKTTDYSNAWDGKVRNEVPNDVYVYKIKVNDLKNEKHTYIGKVSVVR